MQDFRSYAAGSPESRGGAGAQGGAPKGGAEVHRAAGGKDGIPDDVASAAKTMAALFEGKGEGEVLRAIYKEAERSRRAGTLSDADLDRFCAAVAPMLDAAKRKKLEQVIAKLKKIG